MRQQSVTQPSRIAKLLTLGTKSARSSSADMTHRTKIITVGTATASEPRYSVNNAGIVWFRLQFVNGKRSVMDIASRSPTDERFPIARLVMRIILAIFFGLAGLAHLIAPADFLKITPDWVPFAPAVIAVTGLFELVCAAALPTRSLRYWTGIAFAIYSICVWPANFKHAFEGIQIAHVPSTWLYHGPRLAFQPVIIWWSLFSTGVIEWPWRKTGPI
jgi:uncharacterized membrane protein